MSFILYWVCWVFHSIALQWSPPVHDRCCSALQPLLLVGSVSTVVGLPVWHSRGAGVWGRIWHCTYGQPQRQMELCGSLCTANAPKTCDCRKLDFFVK